MTENIFPSFNVYISLKHFQYPNISFFMHKHKLSQGPLIIKVKHKLEYVQRGPWLYTANILFINSILVKNQWALLETSHQGQSSATNGHPISVLPGKSDACWESLTLRISASSLSSRNLLFISLKVHHIKIFIFEQM